MTDGAFGHNCEMRRRNDQKQPSFFNVFIGFIRENLNVKAYDVRRTTGCFGVHQPIQSRNCCSLG